MRRSPGSVVGACVALVAFALAIVAGLSAHNAAATVMLRALVAMAVCYPVGLAAGAVWGRAVISQRTRGVLQDQEQEQLSGDVPAQAGPPPQRAAA